MEMLLFFIGCLALITRLVHGQSQSGFISIDCGMAESTNYKDVITGILYTSDTQFIDAGTNKRIYPDGESANLPKHLSSVRAFPDGLRNCYTFKLVQGDQYLIRAVFMYGNYDSKDQAPDFGLHLNAEEWDSVRFENSSEVVVKEIIHVLETDYVHVCLVNTGMGTPFISALELRQMNNSIYETPSGSLVLVTRIDIGSTSNNSIRYMDDYYDRIWKPYTSSSWQSVSLKCTTDTWSNNEFIPPPKATMTPARPKNGSRTLELRCDPDDASMKFRPFLHIAEVELHEDTERSFTVFLNGNLFYGPMHPLKSYPLTVSTPCMVGGTSLHFSIVQANDSVLPPIFNAFELYFVKGFLQSPTRKSDVEAAMNLKSIYGVKRNWQGDPCVPKKYSWDGLECSYNGYSSPTIISLNLSSSGLSGKIPTSLSNLKSLQSLDLSNNSLTGEIPSFLTQLPLLKTLNLSGNNFTGSIPSLLLQRSKNGSLSLSVDGNSNLCAMASCKKKNMKHIVVPLIASTAVVLVLLSAFLILWAFKSRLGQARTSKPNEDGRLESKNIQFSYSEIVKITKNFETVLGKGGFGSVYHGYLNDGTQVAVKMLSQESAQGLKEFCSEVQLLIKVHHRNLVSLVGYCNEVQHKGLVYEYMANGNLKEHLSGRGNGAMVLSWKQRLRMAVDAAQALEYLHDGCKPTIIHRDITTANILLDGKYQAKVADFGLSRLMPSESRTHISTKVAGTLGYLDPEYYTLNNLNEKIDVYSFGVVLMELVTGRPAIIRGQEATHIADWVSERLAEGDIGSIVDSGLDGDFDSNSAWRIVEIAMACVARSSANRPTISQVVVELKDCLEMATQRKTTASQSLNLCQDPKSSSISNIDLYPIDVEATMPRASLAIEC